MCVDSAAAHILHHCQVFEVIVRLEQSVAGKELHQDTSDAPDVTWERPAETKNYLWRSVMSGRYDGRMIFILECRRTEVDQSDLCVEKDLSLVGLPADTGR